MLSPPHPLLLEKLSPPPRLDTPVRAGAPLAPSRCPSGRANGLALTPQLAGGGPPLAAGCYARARGAGLKAPVILPNAARIRGKESAEAARGQRCYNPGKATKVLMLPRATSNPEANSARSHRAETLTAR